ncbi:MAG: NUDIX domain-containing protein [Bacteroidota bacterium]
MYTIAINERRLIISNENQLKEDNNYFVDDWKEISFKKVNLLLNECNAGESLKLVTFHPEKTFEKIFKNHKLIEAAGGIVHFKGAQLFIKRNGIWDLPKGKREKKESIENCAIREVEEECGLSNVQITDFIKVTFHVYEMNGKKILKKTYWFNLSVPENQILKPQIEEGISEVKWIKKAHLQQVHKNTFLTIRDILAHQ